MIPVIDVFAGPGGLGEGFASWSDKRGKKPFQLAVSFEKDAFAHATLRLRAFRRAFPERLPPAYCELIQGVGSWDALRASHPREAAHAEAEARQVTLGADTAGLVRSLIKAALHGADDWVLVGGPPCQAYSTVGRARNRGIADYRPELDHRQTLYVEYLQILADHAPPVFVMENVKGLLSAKVNGLGMFERIREDLRNPASALRREGRQTGSRRPRYVIHSLVPSADLFGDDPAGYVVKSEHHGIPQRRHRVILVGIREGYTNRSLGQLARRQATTVQQALHGLSRLRSGITGSEDSGQAWLDRLRATRRQGWLRQVEESAVRREINETVERLSVPQAGRGSNFLVYRDETILNHASRGHMPTDLERYLFASAYAKTCGVSPTLGEFPVDLLPAHANVKRAVQGGLFADRFRVQVARQPSTTITSHISKDGHYYIHPDPSQCRSLTVREAARLQTFPDDYFFCGPRTSQYHQVGNAVPPALATQIAELVAEMLGH